MLALPRHVQQEIRPLLRLLEDPFFEHPQYQSLLRQSSNPQTFQPSFDVHETKDAYVLDGELPGLDDKSKLDLSFVDDHTLIVKGRIEKSYSFGDGTENKDTIDESKKSISTPTAVQKKEEGSQEVAPNPNQRYWIRERTFGEFQRTFNFPQNVDHDAVKASLKNGILSIVVPKKAPASQVRKITIE